MVGIIADSETTRALDGHPVSQDTPLCDLHAVSVVQTQCGDSPLGNSIPSEGGQDHDVVLCIGFCSDVDFGIAACMQSRKWSDIDVLIQGDVIGTGNNHCGVNERGRLRGCPLWTNWAIQPCWVGFSTFHCQHT